MGSWYFVSWLLLRHPFCSVGSTFSFSRRLYILWANIPVISFYIKGRHDIDLYLSTTLPVAGSFWLNIVFPKVIQSGKGLFRSRIWFSWPTIRGSNDVRFSNQYPHTTSFPGAFQLGTFLYCIFTISWLISTFSILFRFSNCFLKSFNYSVCWLWFFLMLHVTLFFSVQFFLHLLLVDFKKFVLPKL